MSFRDGASLPLSCKLQGAPPALLGGNAGRERRDTAKAALGARVRPVQSAPLVALPEIRCAAPIALRVKEALPQCLEKSHWPMALKAIYKQKEQAPKLACLRFYVISWLNPCGCGGTVFFVAGYGSCPKLFRPFSSGVSFDADHALSHVIMHLLTSHH